MKKRIVNIFSTFVILVLLALLPLQCKKQSLSVSKDGNVLFLKGDLPSGISKLEVRLISDRNQIISSYHQVSSCKS